MRWDPHRLNPACKSAAYARNTLLGIASQRRGPDMSAGTGLAVKLPRRHHRAAADLAILAPFPLIVWAPTSHANSDSGDEGVPLP